MCKENLDDIVSLIIILIKIEDISQNRGKIEMRSWRNYQLDFFQHHQNFIVKKSNEMPSNQRNDRDHNIFREQLIEKLQHLFFTTSDPALMSQSTKLQKSTNLRIKLT